MIRWPASLAVPILLTVSMASSLIGDDSAKPVSVVETLVNTHCLDCHNSADATAGFDLESISTESVVEQAGAWEEVVKKLRARQMPPSDADQPDEVLITEALNQLEASLDQHALAHPQPGRTDTFRRLTRIEYRNAIRDLLGLDVDVVDLLPADEISHGFDNITVGELSPALLNRYISAAQKISRLAMGHASKSPDGTTIRIRPDVTQEEHVEGLPIGTRGGALISHTFPQDGQYEISARLTRDRNEHVEGLSQPHEVELLIDSELVKSFTVRPPRGGARGNDEYSKPSHENVDQHLRIRVPVTAGPHDVGVTFLKNPSSLLESKASAAQCSFQHVSASAAWSRDLSSLDHRTV